MEPLWRRGTKIERRFSERTGVECRGYSLPLQRVLVDFGADAPFGRVPSKLREHYGIEVPVGAIQRITERHAQACDEQQRARTVAYAEGAGVFIGEMDGSMVPVVETKPPASDRRKTRTLSWREARLCLVHRHGEVTPTFGGHFQGRTEESGRQFQQCAARAGFGRDSELHAVGDGAPWIADQVEFQFAAQGHYLVDFYHVDEYLAAAAKGCAANAPDAWIDAQERRLKANQVGEVLACLQPFLEADEVEDAAAPVRACHRYLSNRLDHLDYQSALQRGLPIGSGAIESAHRYLIQERLKGAGMWWTPDHLQAMLALRLIRANGEWESYWRGIDQEAA